MSIYQRSCDASEIEGRVLSGSQDAGIEQYAQRQGQCAGTQLAGDGQYTMLSLRKGEDPAGDQSCQFASGSGCGDMLYQTSVPDASPDVDCQQNSLAWDQRDASKAESDSNYALFHAYRNGPMTM